MKSDLGPRPHDQNPIYIRYSSACFTGLNTAYQKGFSLT